MNKSAIAPYLAGNTIGSKNGSFVIAEWTDSGSPPGPPRFIAPLHLHRQDDEAWYVLEGTLCVRVGNQDVEALPSLYLVAQLIPTGTPDSFHIVH